MSDQLDPDWRAWFEDEGGERNGGPGDPRIVLIAVDVEEAHYLEMNRPQPVVLFQVVKGMVTGKQPDLPDVQLRRLNGRRAAGVPTPGRGGDASPRARRRTL